MFTHLFTYYTVETSLLLHILPHFYLFFISSFDLRSLLRYNYPESSLLWWPSQKRAYLLYIFSFSFLFLFSFLCLLSCTPIPVVFCLLADYCVRLMMSSSCDPITFCVIIGSLVPAEVHCIRRKCQSIPDGIIFSHCISVSLEYNTNTNFVALFGYNIVIFFILHYLNDQLNLLCAFKQIFRTFWNIWKVLKQIETPSLKSCVHQSVSSQTSRKYWNELCFTSFCAWTDTFTQNYLVMAWVNVNSWETQHMCISVLDPCIRS